MTTVDNIKALLLDLDGTLYRLSPVRRKMAVRLLLRLAINPRAGWHAVSVIRQYRLAQEDLRRRATEQTDLAQAQLWITSSRTGLAKNVVEQVVSEWMEQKPLDLFANALRPGTKQLLKRARARGLRIAVVSDYPARRKLEALGLADDIDVVVSAQDDEVQCFKPEPKGLLVALNRLGVTPDQALYIGDRPDIDAIAAQRAGIRCMIIGRSPSCDGRWVLIRGFEELMTCLQDRCPLHRSWGPE